MKKYLVILACLAAIIVAFGCQSDITLPKETPLVGTYTGTYSYITNYRGGADETITTAFVVFVFGETTYHMDLDSNYVDPHCFCSVDGEYAMTEGVRLKLTYSNAPDFLQHCNACNDEEDPDGVFDRESKGDSLILKMQDGTTLYMLRLLKISD